MVALNIVPQPQDLPWCWVWLYMEQGVYYQSRLGGLLPDLLPRLVSEALATADRPLPLERVRVVPVALQQRSQAGHPCVDLEIVIEDPYFGGRVVDAPGLAQRILEHEEKARRNSLWPDGTKITVIVRPAAQQSVFTGVVRRVTV